MLMTFNLLYIYFCIYQGLDEQDRIHDYISIEDIDSTILKTSIKEQEKNKTVSSVISLICLPSIHSSLFTFVLG